MAAEAVRRLSFTSGPADGLPVIEQCRNVLIDDYFDENKLNFIQDKDMLQLSRTAEAELSRLKEHFAKLKFNYLELVAKKNFLQQLSCDTWKDCCKKSDLAALDATVKEAKSQVKAVKEEQASMKQELETVLSDLATKYELMLQKKMDLRIQLNQLQPQLEASMNRSQEQMSEEECQKTLATQEEAIKELNMQTQNLQDAILEMETDIVPLEDRISALREQAMSLDGAIRVMPQNPDQAGLAEMHAWYSDVNAVISSLSGVEILSIGEDMVNFLVTTQWSSHDVVAVHHNLILTFNHGTSNIADIKLEPNDTPCDDIYAYTLETNDIRFLIRELKMRIRNSAQRKAQVEELKARYPTLKFSGDNLQVTFNNLTYIIAYDMDYPQPYASVHVAEGPFKNSTNPKVPTRLPVLLEKLSNNTLN